MVVKEVVNDRHTGATTIISLQAKSYNLKSVHGRSSSSSSSSVGALSTFHAIVATALILLFYIESTDSFTLMMGLLKVGVPKTWDESKKDLKYIRQAGVRQFISTYNRVKDIKGDELLWGDEIEYQVFQLDPAQRKVRLSLRAKEIMDTLNDNETRYEETMEGCSWVPEYGAWMVEATPRRPYTGYASDLLRVERSMRLRRMRLLTSLKENEAAPTVTAYFMLGAQGDDGSVPQTKVGGPVTLSEYISDGIINPHPRFGTLTANIRQRRGSKVNIRVPLFRDSNTPEYSEYDDKPEIGSDNGCCGGDSQQLWRYGKGDVSMERYGKNFLAVGCSKSSVDEEFDDTAAEQGLILQKWLVDVRCAGCNGLFYRRSPDEIVPDADWPRNGDVVVGYEVQDTPGWIRLQNGYYLPMQSTDGKIQFLHKVSLRYQTTNTELKRIGSAVPLFRPGNESDRSNTSSNTSPVASSTAPTTLEALLNDSIDLPNEPTPSNNIEAPDQHAAATSTATVHPPSSAENLDKETIRPAIHMDAMAFGMGNACLQITFQGKDIDESRIMFDQLAVMAPIMMALTAATPIVKGRIADIDARWGIISESVDCRTPAERGRKDPNAPYPEYNANGERRTYKSRYDSISTFIYQGSMCRGKGDDGTNGVAKDRVLNIYNDIPVKIDKDVFKLLREEGVDPALAQHIAHLFIRDPLVVFNGAVEEIDDDRQTDHFESIQSTNWQTVRWKPPPPRNGPNDPHIGWRTEFRSMELQLTDFENAAYTAFIVLLTRVILAFDLNLYIPLSKVDANMQRAHSRNAAAKGRFYFRRHLAPLEAGDDGYGEKYVSMFSRTVTSESNDDNTNDHNDSVLKRKASTDSANGVSNARLNAPTGTSPSYEENSYEEMTMKEIMCGKGNYFPGLIPLIYAYLDHINCDDVTRSRISLYLDYIERKARGELITTATWMRNFVRTHPLYKNDSVVTDEIAYDLTVACREIGLGNLHVPELLGKIHIDPITAENAYETKLDSSRVKNERLLGLLHRYTNRHSFSEREVQEQEQQQTKSLTNGHTQRETINI